MKEFDFDELDKAVNSLMGDIKKPEDGSPAQTATPPTDDAQSVAITPVTPPSVIAELPKTPPAPEPAASPAPVATSLSPPVVRQSGRFMDVVHPSSDMKTAPQTSTPSREGIALQPMNVGSRPNMSPASFDVVTQGGIRPAQVATPLPVVSETVTETPELPKATEPTPASSDAWASPFLPDTQVEKRPLGGSQLGGGEHGLSEAIAAELSKERTDEDDKPASNEPIPKPVAPPTEPLTREINDDKHTEPTVDSETPAKKTNDVDPQLNPEVAPAALPAELNSDLVAIESGQAGIAPTIASVDGSTSTSMLASSSIPPQYSEQPSTGDASHTPIYDNEAVHQPLAHPAKKKKGWLLIVLIVIILLVGSGLGAAAYFLGLL
ncbi:MAG: hypothetical protein JWM00_651 [Candidatus Saccharibacteria bacterium]|nr:hypothetical protein [Candidatus Saccharibacteria bacterium]